MERDRWTCEFVPANDACPGLLGAYLGGLSRYWHDCMTFSSACCCCVQVGMITFLLDRVMGHLKSSRSLAQPGRGDIYLWYVVAGAAHSLYAMWQSALSRIACLSVPP